MLAQNALALENECSQLWVQMKTKSWVMNYRNNTPLLFSADTAVAEYLPDTVGLHGDCDLTLAIKAMYFKGDSNELLALYGQQGTQISDGFPYILFCFKMCTYQSPAD